MPPVNFASRRAATIAWSLALAAVGAASAQQVPPSDARFAALSRLRPTNSVRVVLTDGTIVEGPLTRVRGDSLFVGRRSTVLAVPYTAVASVAERRWAYREGALLGTAAGAALLAYMSQLLCEDPHSCRAVMWSGAFVGAGVGAIVGALFGGSIPKGWVRRFP